MSEKTEKPTAKRVRDAREEGQVAKSQDVNAVVQLAVILLWLIAEGPRLYTALADLINTTLNIVNLPLENALVILTGKLLIITQRFVFGLAGLLALILGLTGLIQSGFLFAPGALAPSGQRINPLANAKQMVSLVKLFELFKMLLKTVVLGLTFAYFIKRYAASFAHLPQAGVAAGLMVCSQLILWLLAILLAISLVFAAADYIVQRYQLQKQLMMSMEDIKQEQKNSEGNPEIKNRRRELHREVQSGSLASKVARSSVVVRNPTHIAVCLRYEEGETPLPLVLEYGRDAQARLIVALAEKQSIPIVEHVQLARALVAETQPGDYIPESLFASVAQVLRALQNTMEIDDES